MSQTQPFVQPFGEPLGPVATRWWQRPIVAIATVVVVTGLTGGIAYATTRGDSGGTTQNEMQFPGGGGQFPGGQTGQPGQMGQVPGQMGRQQGQNQQGGTTGVVPGQTSRGANSPTT